MQRRRFLHALVAASLVGAACLLPFAEAAATPAKFIPTFTLYYGGGPALTSADAPKLAQFDLIDIDRFRYQNVSPNTWAAVKSLNPNAQVYLYEIGPEFYNDQDSTQVLYVNSLARYNVSRGHPMGSLNGDNPGLFLLDGAGNRIFSVAYSNPGANHYSYLMDFGSSAYQSYWVTAVKADIADQPWVADGVFADNCLALAAAGGYSATPAKYAGNAAWSGAMNAFAAAITAGLHGYGQKLWCNRGSSATTDGAAAWRALDASASPPDMLMEEGAFAVGWGNGATQFFPESSWKLQLDTMAAMQHSGVAMLSHTDLAPDQSGTDNWGKPVSFWQTLWYAMGSFLLGKNDSLNNAYFMFHGADNQYNALVRYPEYDNIDLGKSVGPYQMMTVGGVDVYWREFDKGYVFVNPTPNDVPALTLPQAGQQLTHGNLLSPLSSIPVVSSIALPGHNGAVVLKLAAAIDTTAPTVGVSSPASGATVSGTIGVAASASDNVAVAGVQFQLDGSNLGAEDTAAPYSVSWDTTAAGNASHTLTAIARDAAGNATTSAAVSVTVSNAPPPDTTPPAVNLGAPASGATVSGTIGVAASASDNVGVAGVQFRLDGANLGAEDTAAPYSIAWATTAASNGSHTLSAIARDAAGNRTTSAPLAVNVSNTKPARDAADDFNADGKGDILWRNASTGRVAAWLMNGATVAGSAIVGTVAGTDWRIAGVGDFDGDGKADLLWRNAATGADIVWFMNGAAISRSASIANAAGTDWSVAGSGDLNADGKADLLWRNASTGQVAAWIMNGASVASSATFATVADPSWKIAAVADFDGDGKADLLWRNAATGADIVWFMNGAAISRSASIANAAGTDWSVAGSGDLNADGKADLLWRNASTGQVAAWIMNGASVASSATFATVADPSWKIAAVADFDGDGKADLLWRNTGTGSDLIWFMNGAAISRSASIANAAGTDWSVAPAAQ